MDIVENRKTDGTSQKKKTEAWEDIACHYNNSPNVSQRANAAQLKKMWQNLKTKARDAKTLESQKRWTGGGPAPPAIGSEETQVLSILPTIMPTIEVEIDSDIIQSSTSQFSETNDDDVSVSKYLKPSFYGKTVQKDKVNP
ncbi:unnamed protein product [Arctia plantaginis]|uniref:Regulatory protein zeste n=1 Tax=Arctia plantaginis TaxID=874455 RepID=A0A8S1ADH0_ARCPL|nr:unnamed protein product [Arctia plantaginis]